MISKRTRQIGSVADSLQLLAHLLLLLQLPLGIDRKSCGDYVDAVLVG